MKSALSQTELATLTCDICGKTVKSPQGLKIHKSLSHKDKLVESPVKAVQDLPEAEVAEEAETVDNSIDSNPVIMIHKPDETLTQAEPEVIEMGTPAENNSDLLDPAYEMGTTITVDAPPVTPLVVEVEEPEVQVMDPKILGITEIMTGSLLKLEGPHYVFNDQTISGPEVAEGVLVKVNFRWEDPGHKKFYLRAKSEGGSQQWIVSEEDVLESKNVQIISLGEKEIPANYMPEVPAPPEDAPEVEEGLTEEELAKQAAFLEAVDKYVELRDSRLEAEKAFKAADKELRPIILEYLETFGVESEEGKGDQLLQLDDFKVHYTYTPGEDYIKKDENKILDYLKSNLYLLAIEPKVNWEAWEQLKSNGTIPAQFITEVEQPAKKNDTRKLLVEKL